MTVRAARRIPDLQPGSQEWMRLMTASKVAAVLGLSPWESRFSLYYRLAGQLPNKEATTQTQRGHYLEDAVVRWFADQRTDLRITKTGTWVNKARPWQSATPDGLAFKGRRAVGVVEAKTSAEHHGWGPDGSDEVPPYYRAQVIWQMDTLGLRVGHVAVLLPRLVFRAYTIHYDDSEVSWVRDQVEQFLATLPGGPNECPPDIDEHDQTYLAVRALNPDIDKRDIEIDREVAARFLDGVRDCRVAKEVEQRVKAEMAQLMGNAQRAVLPRDGEQPLVIATRQAKGKGDPYVVAPKTLPELEGVASV